MNKNLMIPDEVIINKIYLIRGQKVMLDKDLAEMFGVETKHLKRQVRRNRSRFPEDFMFELSKEELQNLRSQIGTSRWGGTRYIPMTFTEQGVTMISCILNSDRAVEVNIRIIRIFIKLREMIITHSDILLKLEQLEKNIILQDAKTDKQEHDIQIIFNALKQLLNPPTEPREPIGFKIGGKKDES